jgi:hypothetical protein
MRRVAEFKKKNADVLDTLLSQDVRNALLNQNVVNILKKRDHKGRRVLIVNIGGEKFVPGLSVNFNPNYVSFRILGYESRHRRLPLQVVLFDSPGGHPGTRVPSEGRRSRDGL